MSSDSEEDVFLIRDSFVESFNPKIIFPHSQDDTIDKMHIPKKCEFKMEIEETETKMPPPFLPSRLNPKRKTSDPLSFFKSNLPSPQIPLRSGLSIMDNGVVRSLRDVSSTGHVEVTGIENINFKPTPRLPQSFTVNGVGYDIVEEIGRGGSSIVYKVRDALNNFFALKCVSLPPDEATREQFLSEISILRNLSLQNCVAVVKLLDSEVFMDKIYMVMELASKDIASLLKSQSAISAEVNSVCSRLNFIRYYFEMMVRCVKMVHEMKVIHADLKPANFLVVDNKIKITDFGISRVMQSDTTKVVYNQPMGTLNYMSPESLNSSENPLNKLNRKSDVWSLGCILYSMVYGQPPFEKHHPSLKVYRIADESFEIEFPSILELNLSSVIDLMRACLTRNPDYRISIDGILSHKFLSPENY